MEMVVLEVVLPIVLVALVGYGVARRGVLSEGDIEGISRFVFKVAIPVLLFDSLVEVEMPALFHWQFLFSYYLVALTIYALGYWVSQRWFAHTPQEQGLFGLGSSYSNLVLVGLPIVSAGLGNEALLPLFMLVSVQSALLFFIVILLVERENDRNRSSSQMVMQTLKNLAGNPIIIGLVLGIVANLLAIPIPKPIDDTLNILSQATLPCALFVMGASLNQYKMTGRFAEAWTMIGLKMVVQPILVWLLAFGLFHMDPLWGAVAVMGAGMPIGVNAFVFAQKYQTSIPTLSTAILLSTLLAIVSQSLFLLFFA